MDGLKTLILDAGSDKRDWAGLGYPPAYLDISYLQWL